MSEFAKESLTLEETNKLRISLGLKPLSADADEGKGAKDGENKEKELSKDEIAEENYRKYREEQARKREEEEIRERIARAQNKRDLARKLRGPTLGETDASEGPEAVAGGSGGNALKWLKNRQKKAKEHAERRARELEEQEQQMLKQAQYDERDLAGLRVAHDAEEFDLDAGGEGRVLTLKDSGVLDGDEDELMDAELAQAERDRLNQERKKGAKKYTGLDDEEFGPGKVGKKRSVLSKYDPDIVENGLRGTEEGGFRLGQVAESRQAKEERENEETARLMNKKLLDLDYLKNQEVSDYLQEGDVGFKKLKAKKKKPRAASRIKLEPEDDAAPATGTADDVKIETNESVAPASSRPRERDTENFVDDDELAQSLARARKAKAKRSIAKMTPEQIARNLARQQEEEDKAKREQSAGGTPFAEEGERQGEAAGELTFDDTSEFVRNIKARPSSPGPRARRAAVATSSRETPDSGRETARTSALPTVKKEPEEVERAFARASDRRARVNSADDEMEYEYDMTDARDLDVKPEDGEVRPGEPDATNGITASESLASESLAAALSVLRNQGLVQGVSEEQRERERRQREYDRWLAIRRHEERVREAERVASKAQGSAKDQATREWENRQRELDDARRAQEKFKDYKPDIDIKYHDEYGRALNPHEAWKNLSHRFHGKMPGRKKQELRRHRIEEEMKREKMAAGDTPTGMAKAFAERAEKTGQAHMVIGVGVRNNAPQEMGLVGPNMVAKDKATSAAAAKGKAKAGPASGNGQARCGSPAGAASGALTGLESMGAASMIPRSTMMKKPAFMPIRSSPGVATPSEAGGSGTPGGSSTQKFKLAFGATASGASGAGVKREMASPAEGEPPPKR